MGRYARKRKHKGNNPMNAKYKLKRKTKDLDEVEHDMKPENAAKMLNQEVDTDKAGNAQHYCLHCARHFITLQTMKEHFRGKPHKKRLKALKTEAYNHKEAARAAGMGSYVPPKKRTVKTQDISEPMKQDEIEPVLDK